jgi:PAS domain S-box-containing protein
VEPVLAAPAATEAATILVVDDDIAVAKLERLQLERDGYRVYVAATAEDVLTQLSARRIDLLLLDVRLANGVNGLDVYAQVRAAGFDVPAILVTGLHDEEALIRALRVGVRDVVPKIASFIDLLPGAVEKALNQIRLERRLADSEARLASIIGSAIDAILVADADLKVSLMNAAAEKMFRCRTGDAVGRPLGDFLPAELLATLPAPGGSSVTPLPRVLREPHYGCRANGQRFPLEASLSRGEAGGRTFLTAVVRDITERERAAAKIREQAALLDQANDAIFVRDTEGRIVYWNQGAERLYGWSSAEATGGGLKGTLEAASFLAFQAAHQTASGEWSGEIQHVRKDREAVIVLSRWSILRAADGRRKGTLVIDSDATERKRLETQYLHAQKMETVGTLAGGVAHDFNNLLTVILASAELLLTRPDLGAEECSDLIAGIHRAGERGAGLVRQLLTFSRQQAASPRVLDLNQVVREAERMLRRLIGVEAELVTRLDPDLGYVRVDAGQIEQVIVNLVVNARDAMSRGGRVTIETRNVKDVPPTTVRPGSLEGDCVLITVTDTGQGMDAATRSRAFEPFFTTKEVGVGTGLGLATVHGIVQQAGGAVEIVSQVGVGTTVEVYLPRSRGPAPTDSALRSVELPQGTETILVAEDDADVRATIALTLRSYGYTVMEAAGGLEAQETAAAFHLPIHLLITDVIMPHMRGPELAERLRQVRPELKVLFLSGYTRLGALGNRTASPPATFLQKPFTRAALAQRVRRLLDTPPEYE